MAAIAEPSGKIDSTTRVSQPYSRRILGSVTGRAPARSGRRLDAAGGGASGGVGVGGGGKLSAALWDAAGAGGTSVGPDIEPAPVSSVNDCRPARPARRVRPPARSPRDLLDPAVLHPAGPLRTVPETELVQCRRVRVPARWWRGGKRRGRGADRRRLGGRARDEEQIAHTRSERNPITPQTHDGMCHGVTPFFCLNDSDDRYAMYPMTRPMIKKTIALADDAVASSVMLPRSVRRADQADCPPVPAQGRTHGR